MNYTILLAPMTGFYYYPKDGITQARIAIVEPGKNLKIVPDVLLELIKNYTEYVKVN